MAQSCYKFSKDEYLYQSVLFCIERPFPKRETGDRHNAICSSQTSGRDVMHLDPDDGFRKDTCVAAIKENTAVSQFNLYCI